MGRDVGRDEGREQAEWRDLVARLELQAPINPAEAPWPDRENLRAKAQPGTSAGTGAARADTGQSAAEDAAANPADANPADANPADANRPDDAGTEATATQDASHDDIDHGTGDHGQRGPADRSRVIRPAGSTRIDGPTGEPSDETSTAETSTVETSTVETVADASSARAPGGLDEPTLGGPRDYELDKPRDDDLDELWDDRYIPPPLPPQPKLDPVAKGAWLALFGGPGYLLLASLLSWQITGWAALASVIAFVTGFVVLVFRLGDGPSKRDGPDQGAVV